jgi:hypothetical protein
MPPRCAARAQARSGVVGRRRSRGNGAGHHRRPRPDRQRRQPAPQCLEAMASRQPPRLTGAGRLRPAHRSPRKPSSRIRAATQADALSRAVHPGGAPGSPHHRSNGLTLDREPLPDAHLGDTAGHIVSCEQQGRAVGLKANECRVLHAQAPGQFRRHRGEHVIPRKSPRHQCRYPSKRSLLLRWRLGLPAALIRLDPVDRAVLKAQPRGLTVDARPHGGDGRSVLLDRVERSRAVSGGWSPFTLIMLTSVMLALRRPQSAASECAERSTNFVKSAHSSDAPR